MTNAREAPRLSHLSRFNAGPRAPFTVLDSCRTERSTRIYTHHSPLPTPTNGEECLTKPLSVRVFVAMLDCDCVTKARAI